MRLIKADRLRMEEEGTFSEMIAGLKSDVVCDLICYRPSQAEALLQCGAGRDYQLLTAGTVWVFARNYYAPVDEKHPRTGVGEYGENKIALENLLLERGGRVSVIHPGHVIGRGWIPINPQGNFNLEVLRRISKGEEIVLPGDGARTLNPVHADDVAGVFEACINQPEASAGEAFLAVAPQAVTQIGYARMLYDYFGKEPAIRFASEREFYDSLNEKDAIQSEEHVGRSPCACSQKAIDRLGFKHRFSTFGGIADSLNALQDMGVL